MSYQYPRVSPLPRQTSLPTYEEAVYKTNRNLDCNLATLDSLYRPSNSAIVEVSPEPQTSTNFNSGRYTPASPTSLTIVDNETIDPRVAIAVADELDRRRQRKKVTLALAYNILDTQSSSVYLPKAFCINLK